jgi:putative oxidoreductase
MSRAAALILRVGVGALLAVAGGLKLRDPAAFATEIANYQLLPALSPYLGATLPALELLLGVGLLVFPWAWRRAAAATALALFAAFAVAVGSAYFRHIDIACGCFGGGGDAIGPLTLVRNVALIAAAAALLALDRPGASAVARG